jgi:hypothetical protein
MSRVRLSIDRLVMQGMGPVEQQALVDGLKAELARVLSDPAARADWARSHRTPVVKLGRMTLEPGRAGGRKFGGGLARGIGTRLKP